MTQAGDRRQLDRHRHELRREKPVRYVISTVHGTVYRKSPLTMGLYCFWRWLVAGEDPWVQRVD